MKRKFLINPRSGRGIGPREIREFRRFFEARGVEFDHVLGANRLDAIAQVRQALHDGYGQIVAMGGDGTVNAAVNGFFSGGKLIRPQASLAVARLGSGFDYHRMVVRGARVRDWREIVLSHRVRLVDVGEIRFGGGAAEPVYFINNTSVGMSAAIVRQKESLPGWLPKTLTYLAPTFRQLFRYQATPVRLTLDDRAQELSLITAFVAKGNFGGRGMKFGPSLAPDDGRFEVTVFERMTPLEMLARLGRLYTGRFQGVSHVQKVRCQRIAIQASPPVAMEYDGELGPAADLEIRLLARAMPVCFPQ